MIYEGSCDTEDF